MRPHADRFDHAFLDGADVAVELIRRPEVPGEWSGPSALPEMSIGALACRLGRQITRAAHLLPVTGTLPTLESADAHYARAAWVTSRSPDEPANDRRVPGRSTTRSR